MCVCLCVRLTLPSVTLVDCFLLEEGDLVECGEDEAEDLNAELDEVDEEDDEKDATDAEVENAFGVFQGHASNSVLVCGAFSALSTTTLFHQ